MTLPGARDASGLGGVGLLSFSPWSFSLGSFSLVSSSFGRVHPGGFALSGHQIGRFDLGRGLQGFLRRRRLVSRIGRIGNRRPGADGTGFTAGWLGLLFAHVRNSPVKVDHLVTFIACEIVTGGGLTKILGTHPARFSLSSGEAGAAAAVRTRFMLLCGIAPARTDASFARPRFPINMAATTSQKAVGSMAIEKCIDEFDVDDVIFEEGSTGRELFVVLEGKVEIAKVGGAGKTVIVTLGKGEFFGEMAVIDGSSRSATAISAAADTRVMRINHARFVYLVSQQPAFALMIMDALSKRLRASNAVTFRAANP